MQVLQFIDNESLLFYEMHDAAENQQRGIYKPTEKAGMEKDIFRAFVVAIAATVNEDSLFETCDFVFNTLN